MHALSLRRSAPILALATIVATSFAPSEVRAAGEYQVGAATRLIHPDAPGSPLAPGTAVQRGGNGLGDGSHIVSQTIGAGSAAAYAGEPLSARAVVIDDGIEAVAMVTVETQGMFVAYQRGIPGLGDIAAQVEDATDGGLRADHIVISNDHTHSGPDLIGAWGFVPDDYARFVAAQTRDAIIAAYEAREAATLVAGADAAPDIIYNMNCTEALNQSGNTGAPNNLCNPRLDKKDSYVRVMQARSTAEDAHVITTVLAFAAHATLGGGSGLHGDWPQFMSQKLSVTYGGVGIAIEGAVGATQPCRPFCGFTDKARYGPSLPSDRKGAYTFMLSWHTARALATSVAVDGPVRGVKGFIRHEVENPLLYALVTHGDAIGAPIARSLDAPWVVGNTVLTLTSALRVGNVLINGAPGEAYANIPAGVEAALAVDPRLHWTLGLADDQLGYLIAPVEAYPAVLAEAAVNDNTIFNISLTVGDHVMCAQTRLSRSIGFGPSDPVVAATLADPRCAAWDVFDLAADTAEGRAR
jgi:hypothetical protein